MRALLTVLLTVGFFSRVPAADIIPLCLTETQLSGFGFHHSKRLHLAKGNGVALKGQFPI